jgi:hypothetical protein
MTSVALAVVAFDAGPTSMRSEFEELSVNETFTPAVVPAPWLLAIVKTIDEEGVPAFAVTKLMGV